MSLAFLHRPARRQPRHSAPDERPVAAELAPVTGEPDWSALDVPAAQHEAQRAASGPQAVFTPHPQTDPFAQVPLVFPRGQHPYGPPSQDPVRGSQRTQSHTQSWTPDFADVNPLPRPYVPSSTLPLEAVILPPAIGPALDREFPWQQYDQPGEQVSLVRQRAMSLNYPKPGAGLTEHAAFMLTVDEITGTHGNGRWPLAAIEAVDHRWPAMADALEDAVEALGDTESGRAHGRLLEYVLAAPDYPTARRLGQLANEAGLTGYVRLVPVTPEQSEVAA